jgi:hypothetical protein
MAHVVLGPLIESLVDAGQKMSNKNANKVLVLQAAEVLMQMGHRIAELEEAEALREEPRVVLAH